MHRSTKNEFSQLRFCVIGESTTGCHHFFFGFFVMPEVPHKLFWHGGKLKRDQPRSRAFSGPLRAPPKGILGKRMGQTNIWKRIRKYVRCRPSPHLQKRWQRIRPILGLQAPQNRLVSSSTMFSCCASTSMGLFQVLSSSLSCCVLVR